MEVKVDLTGVKGNSLGEREGRALQGVCGLWPCERWNEWAEVEFIHLAGSTRCVEDLSTCDQVQE
jgi:hypothetical protein